MKNTTESPYSVDYDLTNCDKEPIHIIRYVQPHALVIVCALDLSSVAFISNNCKQFLNLSTEECLNSSPKNILPEEVLRQIEYSMQSGDSLTLINPINCPLFHEKKDYVAIVHLNEDKLIVIEIEPQYSTMQSIDFQLKVGQSIEKIQQENRFPQLFETAANEIKKLTGFDRVMVYQFDAEGHGTVIAEALNDNLEPFLGLRYPATDIPQQARDLFLKNKVRFISDLRAEPAVLFPSVHQETKQAFNQTYNHTRGTSPIHVEYLINMGVFGSMTVAILKNDRLWGLFACHHYESIWLDYSVRSIIKLLSQIISGHLLLNSALHYKQNTLDAQIVKSKILDQMIKSSDALSGLTEGEYNIMHLFDCCGAAVYINGEITTLGETPQLTDIKEIINKSGLDKNSLVWKSHHLKKDISSVASTIGHIAGALILVISQSPEQQFLLWFRKEKKENVSWAGNPEKSVVKKGDNVRLSPRKSFAKWKQNVEDRSEKWEKEEANIALALRSDIKEFFLKMYHELRSINEELAEAYKELDSFSYTVAHDLRAPLRSIKGFAQILEEDYEDKLDEEGKRVLDVILKSADKMNNYINDILNISKLGRQGFYFDKIDIEKIIKTLFSELADTEKIAFPDRNITLKMPSHIPKIKADLTTIQQLFENIIGNAVKYTRKESDALIEVKYERRGTYHTISIKDNGVGFDEIYKNKVFEIFSRLTTDKDFEGTGVGMAIAQKIISKHNGKIDCYSEEGEGSVFEVSIPINIEILENIDF